MSMGELVLDARREPRLEVHRYLVEIMAGIARVSEGPGVVEARESLAGEIFDLLTSREFCYLGRARTAPYRDEVSGLIQRRMQRGEALRFFYDIGPGYHASTRPGALPLRFDVGLSELLILHQISTFCARLSHLYPPGGRFWLVVDNLCGLRTNDIPVDLTEAYCARLRELVRECGLADRVELIVESEEFALEEYDRLLGALEPEPLDGAPPPEAMENVERFLGRRCGAVEAAERIERYRRTGAVTEQLLDRLVNGVHMTQRATAATLGFRPFPGGDARTQCGEVVLVHNGKGRLRPLLLTSRNVDGYDCLRLAFPDVLPSVIDHVSYASPLAGA